MTLCTYGLFSRYLINFNNLIGKSVSAKLKPLKNEVNFNSSFMYKRGDKISDQSSTTQNHMIVSFLSHPLFDILILL